MWKCIENEKGIALKLENSEKNGLVPGICNAYMSIAREIAYDLEERRSNRVFHSLADYNPAKLKVKVMGDDLSYTIVLDMYAEEVLMGVERELRSYLQRLLVHRLSYRSRHHDKKIFFSDSILENLGKRRDVFHQYENDPDCICHLGGMKLGWAWQEARLIDEYRKKGYIEIVSCQRGRIKGMGPIGVIPNETMSDDEVRKIKPVLEKLIASLPGNLESPFQSRDYYQSLIDRL